MSALSRLLDPRGHLRQMPEPDPSRKRYTHAEAIQMFRNHDAMFRMSRDHFTAAGQPVPLRPESSPDLAGCP